MSWTIEKHTSATSWSVVCGSSTAETLWWPSQIRRWNLRFVCECLGISSEPPAEFCLDYTRNGEVGEVAAPTWRSILWYCFYTTLTYSVWLSDGTPMFLLWGLKQNVSPKCWHPLTNLHCPKTVQNIINIIICFKCWLHKTYTGCKRSSCVSLLCLCYW